MIDIRLPQPDVKAGGQLTGTLVWTSEQQKMPKGAIATIGWRTEGRGTVDQAKIQEIQLDPNRLGIGGAAPVPFQFQIPFEGPISYNGRLIRIIWELNVVIDLPGLFTRDDKQTVVFQVLPR